MISFIRLVYDIANMLKVILQDLIKIIPNNFGLLGTIIPCSNNKVNQ